MLEAVPLRVNQELPPQALMIPQRKLAEQGAVEEQATTGGLSAAKPEALAPGLEAAAEAEERQHIQALAAQQALAQQAWS